MCYVYIVLIHRKLLGARNVAKAAALIASERPNIMW